jgi:uncharacterized membrane protein
VGSETRIEDVEARLEELLRSQDFRRKLVDELNAVSLAENLAELRLSYDARLEALEAIVRDLREVVQGQAQMIGVLTQQTWGSGSTVEGG